MKAFVMKTFLIFLFSILLTPSFAQHAFKVIPLGVKGGDDESNLSCYMLAAGGSQDYVCLDAGTIHAGLQKAIQLNILKGKPEGLLRQNIKAFLISHAHLDHVAGLVLNSPEDGMKNIYVMPSVKNIMQEKYFTAGSWINFSDEGEKPLNKYHYVSLDTAKELLIDGTEMFVRAFPLSHGNPYVSTAFFIRYKEEYILYLGDTGADSIEHSDDLKVLWKSVAVAIKSKKLSAIFIECSFPDEQPDDKLFGHLSPHWLMKEMGVLQGFAGDLSGLNVVITHIKPAGHHEDEIKKQLALQNRFGLNIIFAEQGKPLSF